VFACVCVVMWWCVGDRPRKRRGPPSNFCVGDLGHLLEKARVVEVAGNARYCSGISPTAGAMTIFCPVAPEGGGRDIARGGPGVAHLPWFIHMRAFKESRGPSTHEERLVSRRPRAEGLTKHRSRRPHEELITAPE
jgi:hypothetical protein